MNINEFDQALGSTGPDTSGWIRFGFSRNPFPKRSYPIWDVFFNQDSVRRRFLSELQMLVEDSRTTTLLMVGGNRVGKTHLMEYYRRRLPNEVKSRGLVLPITLASAQEGDFRRLYLQIIEQVDDSLHVQTGTGLFQQEDVASVRDHLLDLPGGDLRRAVEKFVLASPAERPDISLWLRRWLRGDKLRATQRELLQVTDVIDSAGQMLNIIEGLVKYLLMVWSATPRCPGLLVFIDEFELLWKMRRDRRDQFLQFLRAMVDACPRGLFLCVGLTLGLGVEIQAIEADYPALYQRIKGSQQREIATLLEIRSMDDASGYAQTFLRHGREQMGTQDQELPELLSDKEIKRVFEKLKGNASSVAQGDFFDRLHELAEERIRTEPAGKPSAAP